jgi:hypothetical protein
LYSTFGHTAIRIKDLNNNLDVVFNYGAFDFRTENFYLKFVKGDLQYFINASSYDDFIFEYKTDQREVIEQTLNFSLAKKQELFDVLSAALFSEERNYTYKFIERNCTTMVVEKINTLIGTPQIQKVDETESSYREVLYPYFEDHFYYKLGINIIFGAKTDKAATKLFLPIELLHSLDNAVVNGKPLVSKKETVVNGAVVNQKFSFWNSIYCVALFLVIIVISHKKPVYTTYLVVLGLLGLFLSVVGLYSLHKEVLWNYNALLFNPLFLILPFLNKKWYQNTILIALALIVIYALVLLTKPFFGLMLPFILATSYVLIILLRKSNKSIA